MILKVKKVSKKVLIEIVLVEESCEISNKQIEKDIRKEAFIPWCENIIKVAVS
jgi:hypothetical protein